MRTPSLCIATLAILSATIAQTPGFAVITHPGKDEIVTAWPYEIVWQPSTDVKFKGPINVEFLQGPTEQTQELGGTIATSIDQATGRFLWDIPRDLKQSPTYGLKITLASTESLNSQIFQYSFPFQIDFSKLVAQSGQISPTGATTTLRLSTRSSISTTSLGSSSAVRSDTKSASVSSPASQLATSIYTSNRISRTSTPTPGPVTVKTGLSTGAKAGIGVGAALGFFLILGIVGFAFCYGQRSAKNKRALSTAPESDVAGKSELPAGTTRASELDAKNSELVLKEVVLVEDPVAELDGGQPRLAELGGTYLVELNSETKHTSAVQKMT